MPRYSAGQIYGFARRAGFSPDEATTMTAIALAESGGDSRSLHGDSRGLWQINMRGHRELAQKYDLYDPLQNARAAYEVSRGGTDFSSWPATEGGTGARYLMYRGNAEAAAVAAGDGAGLGMWTGTPGHGGPVPADVDTLSPLVPDRVDTPAEPPPAGDQFGPAADRDGDQFGPGADRDSGQFGPAGVVERQPGAGPAAEEPAEWYEPEDLYADPIVNGDDIDQLNEAFEVARGLDPALPDTGSVAHLDGSFATGWVDTDDPGTKSDVEQVVPLYSGGVEGGADRLIDGVGAHSNDHPLATRSTAQHLEHDPGRLDDPHIPLN
ncbi:MAG TPA: transglycosylase SLT domain-containing protein [Pilimelia sp.]|nr:transglycosylase SLT domain-containing protein [Pilimelia sp.]